MNENSSKSNGILASVACAVAFVLFTFIYLYFFQADLLFMEQHILSGGITHYDRTVGTLLILVVLWLVQLCTAQLTRFEGSFRALTYFPSFLFLSLLTSGGADFDTERFSVIRLCVGAVMLVLYAGFAFFYRTQLRPILRNMPADSVAGMLWKNLLTLVVLMLLTCAGANTDSVLHYRLETERHIRTKEYDKALAVGAKSDKTDASLTMLRAFALSRTRQLGERLFEYPIPQGGSLLLLPDGKAIKSLSVSREEIERQLSIRKRGDMGVMSYLLYLRRQGLAMKSVSDYILCGYLLDKNLDAFVREIKDTYNVASPSLPKHYKEALTLYTHLRSNPLLVYHSEVMDADYSDFHKLVKTYADPQVRQSYVRDTYGGTYWFYYFYR